MSAPTSTEKLTSYSASLGPWDKARLRWRLKARPKQIEPDGDWTVWLILAGRGWGKTATGAEWMSNRLRTAPPGSEWLIASPTERDLERYCFDGPSGIIRALPPEVVKRYVSSKGSKLIELVNGAIVYGVTAAQPDRFRGGNLHGAWCDELASWDDFEAWDNLMLSLRMGERPQVVCTTTPRPKSLVRDLLDDETSGSVVVTRGSTYENRANLSGAFMRYVESRYEGTRTGLQELHAEVLDEAEGALWRREWIETRRVKAGEVIDFGEFDRFVVALDPAGGASDDERSGDEAAMVVAARHAWSRQYYVLHSEGHHINPNDQIRRVCWLYDYWAQMIPYGKIVVEKNYGDAYLVAHLSTMIPALERENDSTYVWGTVRAYLGKRLRAEPIAALYEQGRVRHFTSADPVLVRHDVRNVHRKLEDQMVTYTGLPGEKSPDRLDALVYALTELKEPLARKPDPIVHVAEVPREDRSLLSAEL